jgi:hypothetical protein
MIKKLLSAAILTASVAFTQAQNFSLKYNFSGITTGTASSGTVDPTPAPVATGITSGQWTAVGTSTTSSAGGVFSFTGWGTGATNGSNTTFTGSIDPGKYYELTLTPQQGYYVSLYNMSFGASRSGTGVRHWAVRTNKDNYATNIAATYTALNSAATYSVPPVTIQNGDTFFWTEDALTSSVAAGSVMNNISNVNFSGANYIDQTTPYTIRVYAWNSEASTGTFRMDTVTINGAASMTTGFGKLSHNLNVKFKLYPNPSHDGIVYIEAISSPSNRIEVINILGAVVASQNGVDEKAKLDLSILASGTYFVRIKSDNASSVEKLIISK